MYKLIRKGFQLPDGMKGKKDENQNETLGNGGIDRIDAFLDTGVWEKRRSLTVVEKPFRKCDGNRAGRSGQCA